MPVNTINPYANPQNMEDFRTNTGDAKNRGQTISQTSAYASGQGSPYNKVLTQRAVSPAAKVEISNEAKQAANPYENAHTASEIRRVTDRQTGKATAEGRNLQPAVNKAEPLVAARNTAKADNDRTTEDKKQAAAKEANPYAKAHTAAEMRAVTGQQENKAQANPQTNLRQGQQGFRVVV